MKIRVIKTPDAPITIDHTALQEHIDLGYQLAIPEYHVIEEYVPSGHKIIRLKTDSLEVAVVSRDSMLRVAYIEGNSDDAGGVIDLDIDAIESFVRDELLTVFYVKECFVMSLST